MMAEIKAAARRHLATDGANLSVRAVARDVGMVSSALYRYFPSRDELLTALILDSYVDLGDAAATAEQRAPRDDHYARWAALCHGIRDWAVAHPPEFALLYGSPVPGYAAPQETIDPASRPLRLMVAIARDASSGNDLVPAGPPVSTPLTDAFESIAAVPGLDGGRPDQMAAVAIAWTEVFGAITFELFGRLANSGLDAQAWFDHQVDAMARYIGLSPLDTAAATRRTS